MTRSKSYKNLNCVFGYSHPIHVTDIENALEWIKTANNHQLQWIQQDIKSIRSIDSCKVFDTPSPVELIEISKTHKISPEALYMVSLALSNSNPIEYLTDKINLHEKSEIVEPIF